MTVPMEKKPSELEVRIDAMQTLSNRLDLVLKNQTAVRERLFGSPPEGDEDCGLDYAPKAGGALTKMDGVIDSMTRKIEDIEREVDELNRL